MAGTTTASLDNNINNSTTYTNLPTTSRSSSSAGGPTKNFGVSTIALKFAGDVPPEQFCAFPILHGINTYIEDLKAEMAGSTQPWSAAQESAYVKFRVVSYSTVPTVLNLISFLICSILFVITLPCSYQRKWCANHVKGSFGYLVQSLFDFTRDIRWITGKLCCCKADSAWLKI